jgi:glycine cleavage system H protein
MTRDEKKLLFAASHEWVDISDQGGQRVATIGISAFAVEQLNDLVFLDLPKVGRVLAVGEEFGEVESVKSVSQLYAPVAGEVIAVNEGLPSQLDQLKDDPYEFGWMVKVRLSSGVIPSDLMDFSKYQTQCGEAG